MLSTFPKDPADPAWGSPVWPKWVKAFRSHQMSAVMEVMEHYENGADVVILNAPTGAGKTIIAEAVRRLLEVSEGTYVANTNSLVDQFVRDFGVYARELKGRANYPTLDRPELFGKQDAWGKGGLSCADCDMRLIDTGEVGENGKSIRLVSCPHCESVHACPYKVAKKAAVGEKKNGVKVAKGAAVAVTNTAYFVTEANGPGAMTGREFVVVDECDTLEGILMGQIEVRISKGRLAQMKLDPPPRKTVEESWGPWVKNDAIPAVKRAKEKSEATCLGNNATDAQRRERDTVQRLYGSVLELEKQLKVGNAIYDGYDEGDVHFKPIRVGHVAGERLWKHGRKWLLMSATIIDPYEFVESVGIEQAALNWEIVNVPSTFPATNRPIYIRPVANMVYKEKAQEWPKLVDGIEWALGRHPGERALIHTVSYGLAAYLKRELTGTGRTVLMYTKASERESMLAKFKRTPGSVLLASSMDRGVDLPEDDCRVVIVTKMPFMSLKDKQVSKRMYTSGGQLWYQVQTIRSLVQMTGRHVRSEKDVGYTYILDRQFVSNVWKHGERLLPDWWKESIDWTGGR